jgi:Cu2+-exporting ATPase
MSLNLALPDELAGPACCPPAALGPEGTVPAPRDGTAPSVDPQAYVRAEGDIDHLDLVVEGISCAACVPDIEGALASVPGVARARVNLTTRRLALAWSHGAADAADLIARVERLGYRLVPYDPVALDAAGASENASLMRALGVAGFAASNVMLLSVAVWAGVAADMGPATRGMMLWFSALITLPSVAYAGMPFYKGAWTALRHGRVAMDFPISVGVIATTIVSLIQTIEGGRIAYYDAAASLLFLLLAGRVLDRQARARARSAAEHLLAMGARAATVIEAADRHVMLPAAELKPGMRILVSPGERVAADGIVRQGRSDLDTSLVTGETVPAAAEPGIRVFAGTTNLTGAIEVEVTEAGERTLLAEIVRLMEAAEQGRARFVRLADRVARLYVPVVHVVAGATFAGWYWGMHATWETALLHSVAVLIITCPCALGIAVPAVQVVATGRLLRRGVLVKAADALERLAEVDTVVFDKTGTLTLGQPSLVRDPAWTEADLLLASRLAGASRHPLARALTAATPGAPLAPDVREEPGAGLEARMDGEVVRLGSRAWVGVGEGVPDADGPELWLSRPGRLPVRFTFVDRLRADASTIVERLKALGLDVELLSGDRPTVVAKVAEAAGIARFAAGCTPADKVARLDALASQGRRVLMVGDGLNDAPALAAAHVSLSPSTAADISQNAADLVFQGALLAPAIEALEVARKADRLVRQNFGISFTYNVAAVPVAMLGFATPLLAAIAMAASSLTVILNALRLKERSS